MSERYFLAEPIAGDQVVLAGGEARHLTSVMRAQAGDEVTLFDGSGVEFAARVVATGKQSVELAVLERRAISRELPLALTLAVALPKGDRQKWLIEKATELGVTRVVPLITARGVAQPVESALERLRRGVVEASKQCGRNRLMEIAPPQSASEYGESASSNALRLWADPRGEPLAAVGPRAEQLVHCAIGPEGGFTHEESAAAVRNGWRLVSLGPRILRIETAALMLAAWTAAALPIPPSRPPG
jgi:16S rRNA (uracil1498-N3)-methyltransferase